MNRQRFNSQKDHTSSEPKTQPTNKKARPEPVYDDTQKELANLINDQINVFLDAQKNVDTMSYDERRASENALFSLPAYPTTVLTDDNLAYVVNRSVRVDRETHLLTRASITIVVISAATNKPTYVLEAFLNTNGGAISVIPQVDDGPVMQNTYRISIKL